MSLAFLLDTTIVSAPIQAISDQSVIKKLRQHEGSCAIAAPVWHEMVYGTQRLASGKRKQTLDEYLQTVVRASFPILPYDEVAAAWHGRERARLEAAGKTPPFIDGQIAAIAHGNGLTLVTANPRHFVAFQGLTIVDWTI